MHTKKIMIIGAGPTGLGAAYRLHELGYQNWLLYEKSDHVGGHSTSHVDEEGFVWDEGGHVIFSHYYRKRTVIFASLESPSLCLD